MDYSVGSIADLISGKNTPGKPKIVKKKITIKSRVDKENASIKKKFRSSVEEKPIKKLKAKKLKDQSKTHFEAGGLQNDMLNVGDPGGEKRIKKPKKNKFTDKSYSKADDSIKFQKKPFNGQFSSKKGVKRKLSERTEELELDSSKKRKPNDPERRIKKSKVVENSEEQDSKPPKKTTNDENAEKRIKKKEKLEQTQSPELQVRTIFIGNVPLGTKKKQLKKLFSKYGEIEAVRFRGIPVANPNTPKKVAAINKEFHPDRKSCLSYIRFVNEEDAEKAQQVDGTVFNEHHLRVQLCSNSKVKQDETKAIFVGNLPFDAEDEELWKLFEDCGTISNTRIIRDPRSGMGRGFAYINFKDSDAVQLALEMENVKLRKRELRISLSDVSGAKRKKKTKQFVKTDLHKRRKPNKGLLEKKRKINKIAPHGK